MKNRISLLSTVDTIYALSSLKNIVNDAGLPGPLGRDEEEALIVLARQTFRELCADLGLTAEADDSVELPGDYHELLQAVVTDRTVAGLCDRQPRGELMRRLRCRLRRLPPKRAGRY